MNGCQNGCRFTNDLNAFHTRPRYRVYITKINLNGNFEHSIEILLMFNVINKHENPINLTVNYTFTEYNILTIYIQ
jgi:hypothetical protein